MIINKVEASLGQRIVADMIDRIIALFIIITSIIELTSRGLTLNWILLGITMSFISSIVILYPYGLSLGKSIVQIKIVDLNKNRASLGSLITRSLVKFLFFNKSIHTMMLGETRLLHEDMSDTRVIRFRPKQVIKESPNEDNWTLPKV